MLPSIVLRADLGERAQRWERIAFIPFGDGPDQLGFHSFGEGPASQPSSVAIGNDDTLWIADRWKFRLAHFTLRGTYLGDVPIDPGDRENRIRDVVRVGTTLYVSTYFQFGRIRAVGPDLRVRRLQVQDRGQALFVEEIFGTSSGAVVEVGGYTDALIAGHQDGPVGYFLLHPDGKLQRIQGIPLRDGSAAVAASGPTRFSVTFHHGVGSLVQPIDVHLRRKGARSATPADAVLKEITPYENTVVALVSVSADRPQNVHDGGRWLLRLGDGPLLWERLPEPGIPDDPPQWRHVAVGPDGSIYLMLAEKGGELILRRP